MGNRTTIYDIAKAANVSVATVSYVINNREDQSISEETKNKVLHMINLLNYKPNVFAKNLRSASEKKLIAICTESFCALERAEVINVLEGLSKAFDKNCGLLFVTPPFDKFDNADAIIAYNVSKETFYEIGNKNYIPLIAVNCIINDQLFFQISADYKALKQKADDFFKNEEYHFVCLTPSDLTLKEEILSIFDKVVFVENSSDLFAVKAKNILAIHTIISGFMKSQNANLFYVDLYTPICNQVASCVQKASSREPFDIHSYRV